MSWEPTRNGWIMSVPSGARCVIVGGGVIGSSVAYHLSKLWKGAEIILLEAQKVWWCRSV